MTNEFFQSDTSADSNPAPAANVHWDKIVQGCREVIAKAKGIKPEEVVLPGDENPSRYVKYAMDRTGQLLAVPRPKGRLKPHRDGGMVDTVNRLSYWIFQGGLKLLFEAASLKAKESGQEIAAITPEEMQTLQQAAFKRATKLYEHRLAGKRREARNRQKVSRRINAGLVPGNADRRAHAAHKGSK